MLYLTHEVVFVFFGCRFVVRINVEHRLSFFGQPLPHGLGMASFEPCQRAPVKLTVLDLRRRRRPVFADLFQLFLHVLIAPYPAVMVDVRTGQCGLGIASAFVVARDQPVLTVGRVAPNGVADQTTFPAVPARADRDPVW